jgi:hypothetical protein
VLRSQAKTSEHPPTFDIEDSLGRSVREVLNPEVDTPVKCEPRRQRRTMQSLTRRPCAEVDEKTPEVAIESEAEDPACCKPSGSEESAAESEREPAAIMRIALDFGEVSVGARGMPNLPQSIPRFLGLLVDIVSRVLTAEQSVVR